VLVSVLYSFFQPSPQIDERLTVSYVENEHDELSAAIICSRDCTITCLAGFQRKKRELVFLVTLKISSKII
jgi:hypothetical protein